MSFHIYVQWNPDFSSHRGKGNWVRIIGRFEKSGIQLQSLTGERKLGLVRISGGVFHLPKPFGNVHWKVHRVRKVFHLTQVPFVYTLVPKMQNGGKDIAVNNLELVIACGTCISTGKFPTGKLGYLFKTPLTPGNFPVERPENVSSISIPAGIAW